MSTPINSLGYTMATERNSAFATIRNNWQAYWNAYRNVYTNRLYNDEVETVGLVNYMKQVVETMTWFIFGLDGVRIDIESEETKLKEEIQEKLNKVLKANKFKDFCNKASYQMLITGDAFSQVGWEEADENNEFLRRRNNLKDGVCKIKLIDIFTIYPIMKEDNVTKIDYYIITNSDSKYVLNPSLEYYKQDNIQVYKSADANRPTFIIDNPITGDFPITHIGNRVMPQSFFGISEFEDLFSINAEYIVKNKSFGEAVDYGVYAPLIIKGAKKKNAFTIGSREVIQGLPKDATIEYLEQKSTLEPIQKYLDNAEQKFFNIAGIPDIARGKETSISNTSSAALKVLYYPLIMKTGLKRPEIDNFIEENIWKILIFMEQKGEIDIPDDLQLTLKYPNPFPKDINALLMEIEQRRDMDAITKEQALKMLEVDKKDINDILITLGKDFAPKETTSKTFNQYSSSKSDLSKELSQESVLKQNQTEKELNVL